MPVFLLGVPIAAALAWLALKSGRGRSSSGRAGAGGLAGEGLAPGTTSDLGAEEEEEEEPFKRRELRRRGGGQDDPETYGNEVGGPYGPAQGDGGSEGVYAEIPPPTQSYISQIRSLVGQPDTTFYGSEVKAAVAQPDPTFYGVAAVGATRSTPYTPSTLQAAGVIAPKPAPTSPTLSPSSTYSVGSSTVKAI